jgi:deoxyribodipyrimidine photolyase-like uncharacterized protein
MTNISCSLDTTDPMAKLGFEAWIDNKKFHDTDHVAGHQQIFIEIPDDEAEHELRLIMKNKTAEHTRIDEAGNITVDARLKLTDMAFDEIQLGHMLVEQAVYTHDFNGTGKVTEDKFYGEMGCNGTVSLKFSTPMYLWLLEHM